MNLRILIADSNVDAAESLAQLLEMYGHRAVTAYTGPDALELAKLTLPDAVFLSLHLPRVSGLSVCRALCASETRPNLLIALTGDGSDRARDSSHEAGFDFHLLKPADPAQILSLLAQVNAEQVLAYSH